MTNEELVRLIQDGIDTKANLWELYDRNRGFIADTVGRYSAYAEMDDLMQEAYFGLARAVELWTG